MKINYWLIKLLQFSLFLIFAQIGYGQLGNVTGRPQPRPGCAGRVCTCEEGGNCTIADRFEEGRSYEFALLSNSLDTASVVIGRSPQTKLTRVRLTISEANQDNSTFFVYLIDRSGELMKVGSLNSKDKSKAFETKADSFMIAIAKTGNLTELKKEPQFVFLSAIPKGFNFLPPDK